jgi:hypothetical protein
VFFNDVNGKKAKLDADMTDDFSSMPSWIRPGMAA